MRVAIVTESFLPSVNGVTNSVLRVLDTLRSHGHDAIVIAPTSDAEEYLGFPVVTTPFVPLVGFPVAIPTPAVAQAIDAFSPDVIHAAAPFWLGGQALAHAQKRGIPSVAVYQTDVAGYMARYGVDFATPLLDGITAAIHRQASLTLAPTGDGVSYMKRLGVDNVAVWGRGVDTYLFTPTRKGSERVVTLRKTISPNGESVIGYVGRLAPEKQVERLKELCGLPNTRILIVGDGPSRAELQAHFEGYPVTFTGRLSGEELADAYAAMDVFVHAGTEETFGQTIQEAHASGLPVIAPARGGQRNLVRHGVDGFLVDHTVWGAFRERVEQLVSQPDLLAQHSRAAREAVEGKTWEKNNHALLEFYRSVLAPTPARLPAAA
jgi:phosphatidylinositol alpha 1,6-mannosyltransferase